MNLIFVAMHCGLLKKRKQQRGVRSLEEALCRTVQDRNKNMFNEILEFCIVSVWHGATERSLKWPYASLLLSFLQKTAMRSHQNRV